MIKAGRILHMYMPSKVGVIGLGSIGDTIARAYDNIGYEVAGNDREPAKAMDYRHMDKLQMRDWADVIYIVVPTPTNDRGCDVSIVTDVISTLTSHGDHSPDASIVIRSTVSPGTTAELSGVYDVPLVHMPEMLRDRGDIDEFVHQDRFVIAGPEAERKPVVQMHSGPPFTAEIFEYDDPTIAELGKYAHNAMWATKVSFANQIRQFAEDLGVPASEVMKIVTADSRVHPSHLDPTLGAYQGRCVPKDTQALVTLGMQRGVSVAQLVGTQHINQLTKLQMGEKTPSAEMVTYDR